MAVVALAMIGMGLGGWIGIGIATLAFKGRFKVPAAILFAVGGIVGAVSAGRRGRAEEGNAARGI